MAETSTLPEIGTIGRVVQPGKNGDWGRDYRVVKIESPVTVLDDIGGDRTRGPCLQLESVERHPNGNHDPLVAGGDHPAEMASVPFSWFKPGPAPVPPIPAPPVTVPPVPPQPAAK
jgi:hypothetical protein